MIEKGNKTIWLITTMRKYVANELKIQGYTKAMEEAGLEPKVFRANGTTDINENEFREMLKNGHPDVAIVVRDSMAVSFDILSVIPKDEVLESSQNYRIHMLMDTLYEHAKSKAIPFATIMNILVGEEFYPMFTVFALLERKEKFGTLTDAQKVLYLDISNWVFNTMEKDLTKDQLQEVVNTYIRSRRRDDAQNKDGNRRYALSTLSETDYPRISSFIKKLIANDDTLKKYL